MAPLLSIAIPTFQRKQWLQKNLSGLLEQIRLLPEGLVELVISENAGTDGSWEYLVDLRRRNPHLVLNRNPQNLGAEGNCLLLPRLTSGTYLWLLGDDDFLNPGALSEIIAELKKAPDFLAVNFAASDETLERAGVQSWTLKNNIEVRSLSECCAYVPHFAMGFLSAWVGRRDFFNRISAETYREFSRWGLSIMLDRYVGIADSSKGVVIAKSMLLTRKPPAAEYPPSFDYFSWFFEGSAAVFAYLAHRALLDKRTIQSRKSWLLRKIGIKRILHERAVGAIDARRTNEILSRSYRGQWEYWIGCLPALYCPGLGFIGRLALQLRNRRRRGK